MSYKDPSATESGGSAETDAVRIAFVEGTQIISVEDKTATVVAGDGCTLKSAHEAWCSRSATAEWGGPNAELGGGNDAAVIAAGLGGELRGNPGSDTLTGNGNLAGEDGPDVLSAGDGDNRLHGGRGNDLLDGGPSTDVLNGGNGSDTTSYAARASNQPVAVKLDGLANDGADPNRDGASSVSEEGDRELYVENATGGAGADRLVGGNRANTLAGGGGMDRFDGRGGADLLDGGTGLDMLDYTSRSSGVAVLLDGARNDGADPNADGSWSAGEENDRDVSIETVYGGSGPDFLRALLPGSNILSGMGGNDQLDALEGGSAADHVYCGTGTDGFQVDGVDKTYACETAVP